MENITSIEEQVKTCIIFLRSQNNDNIQLATNWMSGLLSQPILIPSLINVYTSSSDQCNRLHAITFISQSIKRVWLVLDASARLAVFQALTQILVKEPIWILRSNLIYAIQLTMSENDLNLPLLQFITMAAENGSDDSLLIALLLAPVVKDLDEQIISFFVSLLDRAFSSSNRNFEVKIAAIHLASFASSFFSKYPPFLERFPSYWIESLNIFDLCIESENSLFNLRRASSYFIYALQQSAYELDPLSLLQKCMSLFMLQNNQSNPDVLSTIYNIIQNICNVYPEVVLQCGAFPQIINLTITLSAHLYHSEDPLFLSNAGFFSVVYTDLCKKPEVLALLWQIITQISTTEHGKFVACIALYATLSNLPSFFMDKLNYIISLLISSLSDSSRLLCDAAARTTTIFIGLYGKDIDYSCDIIRVVLEACKRDTTSDLLLVLNDLLNITKDSEDIFEDAFDFLVKVITSGSSDIRSAALSALASLACGSTVKINVHFLTLFQLINEFLQCSNDALAPLKPLAVECLSRSCSVVGNTFDDYVVKFCEFCVNNLKNDDDLDFAVSCFNALEVISQSHPNAFRPAIEPALPILSDMAYKDISSQVKQSVAKSLDMEFLSSSDDSSFDSDLNFDSNPLFLISAISLRVLSYIAKDNAEYCMRFALHIIGCCELQKESSANVCKLAAAVAVGNLAKGIVNAQNPSFASLPARMGHVILSILPPKFNNNREDANLISTGFMAASKVVEWHDYDSLANCLKPLLDIALNLIKKIAFASSYDFYVIDVLESIYGFIGMVISSAEERAPLLLQGFLVLFTEFTNHPDLRFRSIASRFFADIISSSSQVLDPQFKANAMRFAAQLADQEEDQFALACLRVIATREPDIAHQIAPEVYRICLNKLTQPISKSKKFLLMRDNAVSTMAAYAMNIFKESLNFDECIPPILAALPLVLDYSENYMVMDFFIWAFKIGKGKFADLFLRVLIVLFANPPSIVAKLQITEQDKIELMKLLVQLMEQIPDPNQIVCMSLGGDEQRAVYLQEYIRLAQSQPNSYE